MADTDAIDAKSITWVDDDERNSFTHDVTDDGAVSAASNNGTTSDPDCRLSTDSDNQYHPKSRTVCSFICNRWYRCCHSLVNRRQSLSIQPPSIRLSISSSSVASTTNSSLHETLKTVAGVAGNVLEWYDFAVFGFFSDILGSVFFPPSQTDDDSNVLESFAVFGGAFLMRPIGGLVIGYLGDVWGRKYALEVSIFLMAIATTLMGCLPTYQQIGTPAVVLLLLVRMLQGFSVGGQLMSSLVFTLESHPPERWGLYGSFVMSGANFGTFLGGVVAYAMRSSTFGLTTEQLLQWGWRLPFLSGVIISFCGIYLKYFCKEDEIIPSHHAPVGTTGIIEDCSHVPMGLEMIHSDPLRRIPADSESVDGNPKSTLSQSPSSECTIPNVTADSSDMYNPLRLAFSQENRRSLLASSMVPLLWSGGFYLSFVWMPIYMRRLIHPPVPAAFGVNSCSLLLLAVWFPLAGILSDVFGRRRIMSVGGIAFGGLGPIMLLIIGHLGTKSAWIALAAQTVISMSLSLWGAPMCAWLVESFEPEARLTSVSVGYNIAQAFAGGLSPFLATLLTDKEGPGAPGLLLVVLAVLSLIGLWCVAPNNRDRRNYQVAGGNGLQLELGEHYHDESITDLQLGEIT
jgi:MHS family proline/betaine transporter-like MFS transporter